MRCLVTAGNTREPIDSVRMWSNIFTGNTGWRIAQALSALGPVDLLTSNEKHWEALPDQGQIHPARFNTHAELREKLATTMMSTRYDAVFMTAAVADYLPEQAFAVLDRQKQADGRERWIVESAQKPKVSSSHEALAFLGRRSEKIIDLFRTEWRYRGLLVKFKLEVGATRDQLIEIGQASRIASGADYLVANTLNMVSGDSAGAFLIGPDKPEWMSREALPGRMVQLVRESPTP